MEGTPRIASVDAGEAQFTPSAPDPPVARLSKDDDVAGELAMVADSLARLWKLAVTAHALGLKLG